MRSNHSLSSNHKKKKKILFVDNEPDITTMLKMALEPAGFSIDVFNDPLLALENFKPKLYDLAILDVMMPKMDGLKPTLSIIGNVSKSTGILMLDGENDSITPVQQAFLLQQRLTEVNHPDHMLITYPNLGHQFYSSSQWETQNGPIQQYVLADIYSWLEAHSGLTSPASIYTRIQPSSLSNSTAH